MASSRRRLGVALVLDEPVRSEVEGLRRAVGDPSLGRIEPHITLVPPVNVRPKDMRAALARLRLAAATQSGPLVATLGPPGTFLPDNPVLFLGVGGDLEKVRQLRNTVFEMPLSRTLTWPWVPHVTLGDGIPDQKILTAIDVLGDYAAATTFDRVVLLEQRAGRVWAPIADAYLARPAVVGTGGRSLTITRGRTLDPEARSLHIDAFDLDVPPASGSGSGDAARRSVFSHPIVLTARTQEGVAGFAAAWVDHGGAHVGVFVDEGCRREGVGGHLLAHLESAARAAGWEFETLAAHGANGFYQSRSAWARPVTRTRRTSTGPAS